MSTMNPLNLKHIMYKTMINMVAGTLQNNTKGASYMFRTHNVNCCTYTSHIDLKSTLDTIPIQS